MTRPKTTVAGFVAALAAVAIVQLNIQAGEETTALHPPAPPGEVADIVYRFPSIPVVQVFSIYAALAKEKLIVPDSIVFPDGVVRVNTPQPITRTEAVFLTPMTFPSQDTPFN